MGITPAQIVSPFAAGAVTVNKFADWGHINSILKTVLNCYHIGRSKNAVEMKNNYNEERGKIRSWASGIVDEIKAAFGIHSPSAVMRDEVGKNLALGVAEGLYENDKEVVKQFDLMLDKLKYKRNTDIISEDQYYRELEGLRDTYFAAGTQQWQKYTAEIYTHQKKVLEDERGYIENMYDEISEYAQRRLDEVLKKQQRFSEDLKATGGLFDVNTVTINGVKHSYYSMHDLDADIENLRTYGDLLEKIRARSEKLGVGSDITENFLSGVKQMDFEAASQFLQMLDNSSDEKLAAYMNSWNKKNEFADNLSAREYKKEFDETVDDVCEVMKEKLEEAGYEIPDGFYVSGSISAQKFGSAFLEELGRQLEEVRSKIAVFNSKLSAEVNIGQNSGGSVVYNNQTAYNISAADSSDAVEQIRRYEAIKRLSGVG